MKYAIIGNPNCGKSTLFNALTGHNQKIGNWSGVTVDKKTGFLFREQHKIEIVDLPGVYSLAGSHQASIDEKIATGFIIEPKPTAVINVIDAANLERNLYLTLQLLEMKVPIILVLNMMDVAHKKGMAIDCDKLSKIMGCPVIPMIARKKTGINQLKATLSKATINPPQFTPYDYYHPEVKALAKAITDITEVYPSLWLATGIIENNQLINSLFDHKTLAKLKALKTAHIHAKNPEILLASDRYKVARDLLKQCTTNQKILKHKVTEIIDSFCMHKYLGIVIFLLIMYLLFECSITLGGALQPLFANISSLLFIDGATHLGLYLGLPLWLVAMMSQGIGLGLNTVLTFIPQIGCLFLFLSFLEDSGYMARAAFVMDRFMQTIGLPGKAFVPLIVGFGCNVPSVMATRTLDTARDRLMSIMMAPFISCGARLAIFAVFAAAFFLQNGALVVFSLYLIGIIGAILTGYVIKFTFLRGKSAPFIMELPVYHLPNFRAIVRQSWQRLKSFIFRAGKVIIPMCIIIGTLNSIELNGKVVAGGSKQSILARAGVLITPVFQPMGITPDNWPATVGLLTGSLAKEVVIGTLNTLYTQNQPQSLQDIDQTFDLKSGLIAAWEDTLESLQSIDSAAFINPITASKPDTTMDKTAMGSMILSFGSMASAFAYMLFVLLYIPCASVIAAIAKEATRHWALLSMLWSLSIAYAVSVIAYQITYLGTTTVTSLLWIVSVLIYMALLIAAMKYIALRLKFTTPSNCVTNCYAKKT